MAKESFYPAALTVAGSDSSGGAGIQTDLRTFNAFGVYGCSAITALTAQNPREVRGVFGTPSQFLTLQLETIIAAMPIQAAKTGMLFNRDNIVATAAFFKTHRMPLVVDPVMVSTSGARLLQEDAVAVLAQELLPLADWITPNIPEAELLLGRRLNSEKERIEAAAELASRFHACVLLKAGHAQEESPKFAADILAAPDEGKRYRITSPRIPVMPLGSHGTGCTLSAAIAANLALGENALDAVCEAKSFLVGSLAESVALADDLSAMYPPEEEYQSMVVREEIFR
ncbi:MAG: bifunctional hydroxymethylpyrimidine kinase/phosphomethylpyrimidine kinase [Victivallaceae bacterium]|nr:bifunctional hydroxymethylpyrimidine kinase/phosphomethylpyrimidine kinase [Victivallaceae bacterium]